MDANQTVWIASGVTTYYAEDAANVLASGNLGDKGFWNKTRKCGDVNGDGKVNSNDMSPLFNGDIKTSKWASDVNCDSKVNSNDMSPLFNGVLYCCSDC
jgi:hypothetical protein